MRSPCRINCGVLLSAAVVCQSRSVMSLLFLRRCKSSSRVAMAAIRTARRYGIHQCRSISIGVNNSCFTFSKGLHHRLRLRPCSAMMTSSSLVQNWSVLDDPSVHVDIDSDMRVPTETLNVDLSSSLLNSSSSSSGSGRLIGGTFSSNGSIYAGNLEENNHPTSSSSSLLSKYPRLSWTANFGKRSKETSQRLEKLIHSQTDLSSSTTDASPIVVPGVTIVTTRNQALIVLDKLLQSAAQENSHRQQQSLTSESHAIYQPRRIHAVDTEVMDIDLSLTGPIGHGYVTCLSLYSGPDFDYGLGQQPPGSALWIDNLDASQGLLEIFRPWLEDPNIPKVWHNYGFDRHVLYNEGINVQGLGGDTMHMARLCDTSRIKYSLESLTEDYLKQRKRPMKELFGIHRKKKDGTDGLLVDLPPVESMQRNEETRGEWIKYSALDAKSTHDLYWVLEGKLRKMQWFSIPLAEKKERHTEGWIDEGTSQTTSLEEQKYTMMDYYNLHMRPFGELLTDLERRGMLVAKDYLAQVEAQARLDREKHLHTFRQWAYQMIGPDGLALNTASSPQLSTFLFGGAVNPKTMEKTEAVRVFQTLREEVPEDALEAYRNHRTDAQRVIELASQNDITDKTNTDSTDPDALDQMKVVDLKVLCKEYGLKVSGKKAELQDRLREYFKSCKSNGDDCLSDSVDFTFSPSDEYDSMSLADLRDACHTRSLSTTGKNTIDLIQELRADDDMIRGIATEYLTNNQHKEGDSSYDRSDKDRKICALLEEAAASGNHITLQNILTDIQVKNQQETKYIDVTITSLGMTPDTFTASGTPSATAAVLKKLAGDPFANPPKYGTAYDFFGGGTPGHQACVAFYSLTAIGSIDTMIGNFLTPLQTLADDQNRVHCSLNLNTETGRLSSRKPNMQNQPALEKDTYKIRRAFIASPGNRLIVADYGQLELRLLASMTDCTSMIEAFEAGGDFHSRTALGMFDYIQDAVNNGDVLLEWDYSQGESPPKPMLKDQYASERRKAKTLNFSIAYGKTAHGLSKDWGVEPKDANDMLKKWYDSRPEVEEWQKKTKESLWKHGLTRTLMGRYRHLPHGKFEKGKRMNKKLVSQAERASINTPIQGGAADVVMMAMLKINNSEVLKRLGWVLLMQVHDEVILEGPEDTAEEAFKEVIQCMQEPWVLGLERTKVPLLVDGSCAHDNWYDAK